MYIGFWDDFLVVSICFSGSGHLVSLMVSWSLTDFVTTSRCAGGPILNDRLLEYGIG